MSVTKEDESQAQTYDDIILNVKPGTKDTKWRNTDEDRYDTGT